MRLRRLNGERFSIGLILISALLMGALPPTLRSTGHDLSCASELGDWQEVRFSDYDGFVKLPGQRSHIGNFVKAEYTDDKGLSHSASGIVIDDYSAGLTFVTDDAKVIELNAGFMHFQKVFVRKSSLVLKIFTDRTIDEVSRQFEDPFVVIGLPPNETSNEKNYLSGFLSKVISESGRPTYQIKDPQGREHLFELAFFRNKLIKGVVTAGQLLPTPNPLAIKTFSDFRFLKPEQVGSIQKQERRQRDFDISDILSVTTGRLLSTRHVDGLYDILAFMTNSDEITLIGSAVVATQCRESLIEQYPALADAMEVTKENHREFVEQMRRKFGDKLSVTQVDPAFFDMHSDYDYWSKIRIGSSQDRNKVPDLYRLLEADRTASIDAIKANYRRLAKLYHPDRNPGDKTSEETFKKINAAYDVLGDPRRRAVYDSTVSR